VRINLIDDVPIYHKPYKRSEVERKLIQARTAELLGAGLVELAQRRRQGEDGLLGN
jgi:hypothetical protein